jgi:hypothetical protein
MTSETVAIIGAISALLLGVFGFVIKMWKDHTELSRRVLEVVERNATANEKLTSTVMSLKESTDKNTQATQQVAEATRQTRDTLSQLMIEVVKNKP